MNDRAKYRKFGESRASNKAPEIIQSGLRKTYKKFDPDGLRLAIKKGGEQCPIRYPFSPFYPYIKPTVDGLASAPKTPGKRVPGNIHFDSRYRAFSLLKTYVENGRKNAPVAFAICSPIRTRFRNREARSHAILKSIINCQIGTR